MFTGPVGPVEVIFYWPETVFGNFYWPGAIGLPLASSPVIHNQLQPTDRLSIIISSSHSFGNWVQA